MKKYTLFSSVFILSLILLGSLGFNVKSTKAYDSGCIGSGLYSINTGQLCNNSQYGYSNYNNNYSNNYSYGCTSAAGPFNIITGQLCDNSQYGYSNNNNYSNNYSYGCTSTGPFNIITGQLCDTSQYSNTYQNIYPYYNQTPIIYGSSSYTAPVISSTSVSSGRVGTQVTIYGRGFNNNFSSNTINFGLSIIPNIISSDGATLAFTIPAYTNSACQYTTPACIIPQYQIITGAYPVFVTNLNGTSNAVNFTVTY